ncbi:MAG: alpha/beta hydrolase [Terriglobales bacterium]
MNSPAVFSPQRHRGTEANSGPLISLLSFCIFTFAFCILHPPAHAASRVECNAVRSAILKRSVRYCALLPASYDAAKARRFPVLYYLHGLGADEQSLVQSGGWSLVEGLQEEKRIGEFVIITPDGGRSFYINSRDGRLRYEDFFIREFLPAVEKRYRIQAMRASRAIAGTSMGGYGALRFAFRYPQLFSAVSAHSAAVMEKLPQGAGQTPGLAGGSGGGILGDVFGTPLDPAFYDRNNPLTLARATQNLARLRIYFDCGRDDEYNFDAGAEKLNQTLASRRIPHEFHIYPGGHGWRYVAEHLDESLEFHSKAFGLTK